MRKHESRAMPFTGYVVDARPECPWCAWALAKGAIVVEEKHETGDEARCSNCGNTMVPLAKRHGSGRLRKTG